MYSTMIVDSFRVILNYMCVNTNYNFFSLPLFLVVFNIKHNLIITMATRIRRTPPPTPIVIAAHKGSVVVDSVIVS